MTAGRRPACHRQRGGSDTTDGTRQTRGWLTRATTEEVRRVKRLGCAGGSLFSWCMSPDTQRSRMASCIRKGGLIRIRYQCTSACSVSTALQLRVLHRCAVKHVDRAISSMLIRLERHAPA